MKNSKLMTLLCLLFAVMAVACGPTSLTSKGTDTESNSDTLWHGSSTVSQEHLQKTTAIIYSESGGMPRYDQAGRMIANRKELRLAIRSDGKITAELGLNECNDRFQNVSGEHYLTLEGLVLTAQTERVCPVGQTCMTIDAPLQSVEVVNGTQTRTLKFTSGDVRLTAASQVAIANQVNRMIDDLLLNSVCRP